MLRRPILNYNNAREVKKVNGKKFIKPQINIVPLDENDIIVTSNGIPLPDVEWDEEE